MFADLDETIRQLLIKEVPLDLGDVDISFGAPDRDWSGRLSKALWPEQEIQKLVSGATRLHQRALSELQQIPSEEVAWRWRYHHEKRLGKEGRPGSPGDAHNMLMRVARLCR